MRAHMQYINFDYFGTAGLSSLLFPFNGKRSQ